MCHGPQGPAPDYPSALASAMTQLADSKSHCRGLVRTEVEPTGPEM